MPRPRHGYDQTQAQAILSTGPTQICPLADTTGTFEELSTMTDYIICEERRYEPQAAVFPRQAVRISPRTVLQSLSTLRIEKTRIEPLETENSSKGGNADVIPAQLKTETSEAWLTACIQHIAIKKLRLDCDTDDARVLALLAHEISLLNNLCHDNIVKVIGFVEELQDGIAWLILPWERNGNLREFIQSTNWEFPERIALIYNVVAGIDYLHHRTVPICHGDLKSLNILVNSKNQAVLTDFGSARPIEPILRAAGQTRAVNAQAVTHLGMDSPRVEVEASGTTMTLTGAKWTLRWAAPELLNGSTPDLASDIWAFGWICWEVMTSNLPFDGENDVSVMLQIVEGKLPPVHDNGRLASVVALAHLMADCWSLDPTQRPAIGSCKRQVFWMDRCTPCSRDERGSSEIRSARLLSSVASMHIRHNRLGEAMDLLLRAEKISVSTRDARATAAAFRGLGEVYRLRGEYSAAKNRYLAAQGIYSQLGDQIGLASTYHRLGEVCRLRGESSQAEQLYLIAGNIYTQIGNEGGVASVHKALGDVYHLHGEAPKARESYIVAKDIYSRIGDQGGLANSFNGLGEVYRLQGDTLKAEESYFAAGEIYVRVGNQGGFASVVKALGDVYHLRGEASRAEEAYIIAGNTYAQIGSQGDFAYTAKALGDIYRLRGDTSKAEQLYTDARDIFTRVGNSNGFAYAVKALGDIYHLRGQAGLAQQSYFAANQIYARTRNLGGVANTCNGLGESYRLTGKISEAHRFCMAARGIYSQIENWSGFAYASKALGDIYLVRGELNISQEQYVVARRIYARIGNQGGVANAIKGLGDVYHLQGKYLDAEESYITARAIYVQVGDQIGLANASTGLCETYAGQKDYTKAEELCQDARSRFATIGCRYSLANNLWFTGKMYRSQGRYEEAESVVCEALALYTALNLGTYVSECHQFLQAIMDESNCSRDLPSYLSFPDLLVPAADFCIT